MLNTWSTFPRLWGSIDFKITYTPTKLNNLPIIEMRCSHHCLWNVRGNVAYIYLVYADNILMS